MMKTVIIYVSRGEGMAEAYKPFFRPELEQNVLHLLEYQKKDGTDWQCGEYERVRRELERAAGAWTDWKLIIADDRMLTEDTYLHRDEFLRNLVEKLSEGFAGPAYQGTPPEAFYLLCSLDDVYERPVGRNAMGLPPGWHQPSSPNARIFFYYHQTKKELPYKCRSILYYLLLLCMARYELPADRYRSELLYRVDAEWDWDGFHRFLEQMERQYAQMERNIREASADTQDFLMSAVYADTHITPQMPGIRRKRSARWARHFKDARKEIDEMEKRFRRDAKKCFQEVRQTFWRHDVVDWDPRENQRAREQYQKQLQLLYENGIFDYEETQKRINTLLDEIEGKQRKYEAGLWGWGRLIAAALALFLLLWGKSPFWFVLPAVIVIVPVFLIALWFVMTHWSFRLEEQRSFREEYKRILRRMEGFRNRINRELDLMVKYRHQWHKYIAWKKEQERLQAENREGTQLLLELARGRQWLDGLRALAQTEGGARAASGSEKACPLSREYIYRQADWEKAEGVELPGGERISFPYPMLRSVKTEKCKD